MVRLLAIFAPAFALLVAAGTIGILKPFYTLLREAPQIVTKAKRGIARVSKEYSAIAILLVFVLLVTQLAFSPQNMGIPRAYGQAYNPITISASSLPIVASEPIPEWTNMLLWTQDHLESTTVVCAWWDYGYWLTILGNVTTLADNATINATQIENIGFIFMANETYALKMLAQYDAKYILVFVTLGVSQTSQQSYSVSFSRYGDEGKWTWMASISGQARQRFIDTGFIDEKSAWENETQFGTVDNQTGQFTWNDQGKNSVIYKLMTWAKQRWSEVGGGGFVTPDEQGVQPTYFTEKYFSGESTGPFQYGGIVPVVALYEIDWQKYYNDTNTTG
jgi:dolichyl-diphosphooligosaccharide--protein glycosyltransferase